jgi:hypothetical protein
MYETDYKMWRLQMIRNQFATAATHPVLYRDTAIGLDMNEKATTRPHLKQPRVKGLPIMNYLLKLPLRCIQEEGISLRR